MSPQPTIDDFLRMFGGGESLDEMMDILVADFGEQAHTIVDKVCKLPQSHRTPYTLLGLDPSAPNDVVELVYKHLARKYHPDMKGGDNEKMKVLNVAYEQIMRTRRNK